MQTITYYELLQQVSALCGLTDPDVEATDAGKKAAIDRFTHRRVRQCHDIAWWPETMRSEERFYRADYASGTAYTVGQEVYHPASQQYYRALRSTTGNAPATLSGGAYATNTAYWIASTTALAGPDWADATAYTVGTIVRDPATGAFYACHTAHTSSGSLDATKFGVLGAFSPTISLDQVNGATTLTPIGRVRGVFQADPWAEVDAPRLPYALSPSGIELLGEEVPATAWVLFQVRPPQLRGTTYSASATYAVGQYVYYASTTAGYEGDFYKCATATTAGQSPESSASKWTKQEIPAWLRDAVAHYAAADYLRSTGARDQAALEEQAAQEFLAREILNHRAQQDHLLRWRAA